MLEKRLIVNHPDGLHARPASVFVREAGKFKADIELTSGGVTVNGKSILGILTLALYPGSEVTIHADGPDESEAVESLSPILTGDQQ